MFTNTCLGLSLFLMFTRVVSIEDKNSMEDKNSGDQNATLTQEIVVRTKSASPSTVSKELEAKLDALTSQVNAKLDVLTLKMDALTGNVQINSKVNSTTLNQTADGGSEANQDKVAPGDDKKQVGGKKAYCDFNIKNVRKLLIRKGISFDQAWRECQNLGTYGGFLAMPKSGEDMFLLAQKIVDDGSFWLGAKENLSKKKNNWFWLSGEHIPESFLGWQPGWPHTNDGESRLTYTKGYSTGLANYYMLSKVVGYFCQKRDKSCE